MEPNNQTPPPPNNNLPEENQPKITTPPNNLPEENQPVNPNSPKPKTTKKIIYASIAAIIITLAIITGFSFYSYSNPNANKQFDSPLDNPVVQEMANKLPIPKITMTIVTRAPTPTYVIDPQTTQPTKTQTPPNYQNWKTYNNKNLKFSLTYPPELEVVEKDHGFGVMDITFSDPSNPDSSQYQILTYPSAIENFIGHDFNTLYELPENTTELMAVQNMPPQLFTKVKNRTVNNQKAFDFEATEDPPDPYVETEAGTYVDLGKSRLIISSGLSSRATLDQMLTTFKTSN